ncbi:MAG: DUF5679 domain-containing protein [Anaerolineae bacterium]
MAKSWRWVAIGALIGVVVGWLLLRRRLTRSPRLSRPPAQEEAREDRIVLPLSGSMRPSTAEEGLQGGVKGEITLPGGRSLKKDESAPPSGAGRDASIVTPAASDTAEPEDDRIELPLPAAASRPSVGELNGTHPPDEAPPSGFAEDEVVEAEPGAGAIPDGSVEAYCVRCKTQRPMIQVTQYVTSKNRAALKGTCAVCGAGMFKFIKE